MNCSLVALYKRATMSKTLSISFKKSDITDLLVIRANCSHKTSDSLEKTYFSYVFDSFSQFSSLYMPKSESLPSLFDQSLFLKEGRERFTTKKWPWANPSRCSLQMSDRERFAPIAYDKRATGAICSFSWANRFFTHKNDLLKKPMSEFPTLLGTGPHTASEILPVSCNPKSGPKKFYITFLKVAPETKFVP